MRPWQGVGGSAVSSPARSRRSSNSHFAGSGRRSQALVSTGRRSPMGLSSPTRTGRRRGDSQLLRKTATSRAAVQRAHKAARGHRRDSSSSSYSSSDDKHLDHHSPISKSPAVQYNTLQARTLRTFGNSLGKLRLKFEIHDLTDVKSIPKIDFIKTLRAMAPGTFLFVDRSNLAWRHRVFARRTYDYDIFLFS